MKNIFNYTNINEFPFITLSSIKAIFLTDLFAKYLFVFSKNIFL